MPTYRLLPLLTLSAIACVAVVGCQPEPDPFAARKFDSAAWKAGTNEQRAEMARDLICHHLPAGMTKTEVKDRLGEVTPKGEQGETWSYYLGCWYEVGLDSAFVYVHFGKDGKLNSAVIGGG